MPISVLPRLGREKRRFVEQVGKIRAGETDGRGCNGVQIDIRIQRFLACMNLQDCLAAVKIGDIDRDLAVKPSGTEQGGVENVGTGGRRHDDNAVVGAEAVHFDEQLVERLLALIMSAAEIPAPR